MRRRGAALIGAAIAVVALVAPAGASATRAASSASIPAAANVNPVSLIGEGSDDLDKEMPVWSAELYGSGGNLSLTYTSLGGQEARTAYTQGIGNFVVSGTPWPSSDLAQVPASAGGLISAPVMVSAVGFLLGWGPVYHLNRSCAQGAAGCTSTSTYTGPLAIPSTTLVDILWNSTQTTSPATCGCLSDQSILTATAGQVAQGSDTAPPTISTPSILPPTVALLRSEPSETNYYLQLFAQRAAPGEFAQIPRFKPPVTDYLQGERDGQYTVTQQGVQSQMDYFTNEGGSVVADNPQGVIAPVPPNAPTGAAYYLPAGLKFSGTPPAYPLAWVAVENASGQWVTPSPSTIDAAVDAGGAQPLYGLSNPVGGSTPAYPLTYVNDLYAPRHGLTADQTEATATVIRYLATAGQDATAADNDGQLSPGLVQQSLAAANQIVASNCTAASEQVVVSNDIGRYAPTLQAMDGKTASQRQAELASIGPMLHCVIVQASSGIPHGTTVTTIGSPVRTPPSSSAGVPLTPTPAGQYSPGTSPAGAVVGTISSAPAEKPPGAKSTAPAKSAPAAKPSSAQAVTLADLPLPLPWTGGSGYDRLAGMGLGALIFLLLWRARGAFTRILRP